MKNRKYGITFGIALGCVLSLTVLLVTACEDPTKPTNFRPPVKKGYGRISVSFVEGAARTAFPSFLFDHIVYTFTKIDDESGDEEDLGKKLPDSDDPVTFTLEVGTYTMKVEAYIGDVEPDNLAARGTSAQFTVSDGSNDDVRVGLVAVDPLGVGKGEFSYTITYPAGATADITLEKWPEMTTIDSTVTTTEETEITKKLTALDAGIYQLTVLITKDGQYAGTVKAVHIKPLLTTEYKKIFEDNDLLTPTVVFDKNTADSDSIDASPKFKEVIHPATTVGTLPKEPTRLNYAFIGWNTQADGNGTPFTEATPVTESIIVYARWAQARIGSGTAAVYYTTLDDALTDAESGDTVTVLADISTDPIPVITEATPRTISLTNDGSPRTIALAGNGSLFTVGSGVTLIIKGDSTANTLTLKGKTGNNAPLVCLDGGDLELYDNAVITGNENEGEGENGGGGVWVGSNGTFTMNGGTITSNSVKTGSKINGDGGGVFVWTATFDMQGGIIIGNHATAGGGVYNYGTFTMSGDAVITGNEATDGGGVYVIKNTGTVGATGTFTMSDDAVIQDNEASGEGGGVYVDNGTFEMKGGFIYGSDEEAGLANTAASGASLYVNTGTAQYMPNLVIANIDIIASGNSIDETLPAIFAARLTTGTGSTTGYLTLKEAIDDANAGSGGTITLMKDVTTPEDGMTAGYPDITKNITLIPYGTRTINAGSGDFSLFTVNSGAAFTLGNGVGNLTLEGGKDAPYNFSGKGRRGVLVKGSGQLVMNDNVTITGFYNHDSSASTYGSGVHIESGTFEMNGGEITGNRVGSGSGYGYGGGVYVTDGDFYMRGGSISGNKADDGSYYGYGGGVGIGAGGAFYLITGEISYNLGGERGGGVYVNGGIFTMEGGDISNNSSLRSGGTGGGVYVNSGTFEMKGGTIYGSDNLSLENTALIGAAVCVNSPTATAAYAGDYAGKGYGTAGDDTINTTHDTLPPAKPYPIVSAPTLLTNTHNSITINPVTVSTGQTVEYACSTTNSVPSAGWQPSPTFTGLSANTNYYIFAQAVENSDYSRTVSSSLQVTTSQSASQQFEYYWVDDYGDLKTTSGGTVPVGIGTTTLTITQSGTGTYTGHQWYLNGVKTNETSNTYNFPCITIGKNTVDLLVQKGAKWYSASITIEVHAHDWGTWTGTGTTVTRTCSICSTTETRTVTAAISNQAGLAAIAGAGTYVLTDDITVNNWMPIGGEFTGTLDGNGNTITINDFDNSVSGSGYVGLFRQTNGAEITDLNVAVSVSQTINSTTATMRIGAVSGYDVGSDFSRVSVTGDMNITVNGVTNRAYLAGLVGAVTGNATIEDCYSGVNLTLITPTGNAHSVGGITNINEASSGSYVITIKNCLYAGSIYADTTPNYSNIGGILGRSHTLPTVNISNCAVVSPSLAYTTTSTFGGVHRIAGDTTTNQTVSGCVALSSMAVTKNGAAVAITSNANDIDGEDKTAAQLTQQATYAGWDFTNVWQMGANWPLLR